MMDKEIYKQTTKPSWERPSLKNTTAQRAPSIMHVGHDKWLDFIYFTLLIILSKFTFQLEAPGRYHLFVFFISQCIFYLVL